MEEPETDRKHQLDKLRLKLDKIRQSLNEDDTGNMNNVISSNSPEACLSYLTKLEKKGDLQMDPKHLCKVLDFYTRVFSNMPLGKHCQNETYARMLVRFAELKAIQDVREAEANFNLARSHCPRFAFVHISYAEFEHSHGNTKKAIHILQRAIEEDVKPKEMLEATLLNLQSGKTQLACSEDKENSLAHNKVCDSAKQCSEAQSKASRISDGTGELHLPGIFSSGREPLNSLTDDQLPSWRSGPQKRAVGLPGRVPILPFSIPETDDDSEGQLSKKEDVFVPKSLVGQTSGPSASAMITMSSSKTMSSLCHPPTVTDGDFHLKPPNVSPDARSWADEEQAMVDSTTTLLNRPDQRGTDKMEDTTSTFNQIISSYSPESCQRYLCNLEKRGNPHTDLNFLNKLKGHYDKVFAKMPMVKYSKNESYVRMLVRFAELKGIEDPEEAEDHFIVLRSHCKGLAFVHVAHAQFEVSQGNTRKAASILHKASTLKAKPVELLETALGNLKSGKKELMSVSADQEGSPAAMQTSEPLSVAASGGNHVVQAPGRVPVNRPAQQPQSVSKEPSSEWKIPATISRQRSSEEKHISPPPDARPAQYWQDSLPTPLPLPSTLNAVRPQVYQTPNNPMKDPYGGNSYITPVVKRKPEVTPSTAGTSAPAHNHSKALHHQVACTPIPQASVTASSNETITIKGRQFDVLKKIGQGGSSKVYQVLDHKKQLYAVKQVNLEEADAQTVQSYKNEIEHLNHLQQYSEQIIKLYDYEITDSNIFMLMELGNLDLNTWLKKRKTVNQIERKYYWKNMLEAVSTIHKHGIVHSDLKPANFVIVNASLKLIDFGIANQIQPDVTSIMKDSQVGTLSYMPPEVLRYTTGKASSKISPKGDVWSLGCILYCMTYGKTPFQSIINQISKIHAITDPSFEIEFPDIPEKDLLDVLKKCLVRNPKERISIAELLDHPYLRIQPQAAPEPEPVYNNDLKKILNDLAALQSPNSIVRAANNLARMCNSGRKLDVAECVKSSHQP